MYRITIFNFIYLNREYPLRKQSEPKLKTFSRCSVYKFYIKTQNQFSNILLRNISYTFILLCGFIHCILYNIHYMVRKSGVGTCKWRGVGFNSSTVLFIGIARLSYSLVAGFDRELLNYVYSSYRIFTSILVVLSTLFSGLYVRCVSTAGNTSHRSRCLRAFTLNINHNQILLGLVDATWFDALPNKQKSNNKAVLRLIQTMLILNTFM